MKYLAIPFLVLAASCVTSGDLRALADAQEELEQSTQETFESLEAGLITSEEAKDQLVAAKDAYLASAKEAADDAESRTGDFFERLTDAESLTELLLAVAGSFYLTNRARDGKRRLRGERVEVTPPRPPPPAS